MRDRIRAVILMCAGAAVFVGVALLQTWIIDLAEEVFSAFTGS